MNLGFQLARQITALIGGQNGAQALPGALGILGLGGTGTNSTPTLLTDLTRIITSLQSAEVANTSALTASTSSLDAETSALANLFGGGGGGLANLFGGGGGGLASLFGGGGDGGLGSLFGGGGITDLVGGSAGSGGGFGGFLSGLGGLLGGFGSLLGVASIGKSLFNLFSGPSTPQQILKPYIPPVAQSREVADLPGFPSEDRSADGSPRAYSTANSANSSQPLQVTVNVSTMDSRSFMDNAPALADAVRQAMLNMSPINQLIRESF